MEAQDRAQYFAALQKSLLHVITGKAAADTTNEIITILTKEQANYEKGYPLPSSPTNSSFINKHIDPVAKKIYPKDAPPCHQPLITRGDGNCFYRAASTLLFGNDSYHLELRVRINAELILNQSFYTSETSLLSVSSCNAPKLGLVQTIKDTSVSDANCIFPVHTAYMKEAISSLKNSTYANIWHMYALASVASMNVQSIYPIVFNCGVPRNIYNQIVKPRNCKTSSHMLCVMWSHMTNSRIINWSPNHFVPCMKNVKDMPRAENVPKPSASDETPNGSSSSASHDTTKPNSSDSPNKPCFEGNTLILTLAFNLQCTHTSDM